MDDALYASFPLMEFEYYPTKARPPQVLLRRLQMSRSPEELHWAERLLFLSRFADHSVSPNDSIGFLGRREFRRYWQRHLDHTSSA